MESLPESPPSPAADRQLSVCLAAMVRERASDLFLQPGAPPTIKCQGRFSALSPEPLSEQALQQMVWSAMSQAQRQEFANTHECDLSLQTGDGERFRVNVHRQRGRVGLVARHVSAQIPDFKTLGLPPTLPKLALYKSGLVLIAGPAGAGKSTTLAALLDYRNRHSQGHILTIEDPIEFLHGHKKSLVTQREVGTDTLSCDEALRRAMREAPNVIMIGEIRDPASMVHALHYAQAGHLCLSTLHAHNASQTVQRVLNFFPRDVRHQVQMDLALNLRAVVAQRLVSTLAGGLLPAVEVLLATPFIAELIQKGQIDELRGAIARSGQQGMNSLDQSLLAMVGAGLISPAEALANADSRTDVSLQLRLSAGASLELQGMDISSM